MPLSKRARNGLSRVVVSVAEDSFRLRSHSSSAPRNFWQDCFVGWQFVFAEYSGCRVPTPPITSPAHSTPKISEDAETAYHRNNAEKLLRGDQHNL
jgi:hypothetical protein